MSVFGLFPQIRWWNNWWYWNLKRRIVSRRHILQGNDFVKCEEKIAAYVTRKDSKTLSDGTKIVKEYNANDDNVNVNKYVVVVFAWK